MKPSWAVFVSALYLTAPLVAQGVIVEVVDYLDSDFAIPMLDAMQQTQAMAKPLGGDAAASKDGITIKAYMAERRGGGYSLPATSGCGPTTLSWNRQTSRATVISGSAGIAYVAAVQASYGVTDTISITNAGTFELPDKKCGYIVGKEGLKYSEFNVYRNNIRIGNGAILYLIDVQIIKNYGTFFP